ncbi:MAG: hypothetical protein EON95_03810, partial [Caulobacteraceae bacterium]
MRYGLVLLLLGLPGAALAAEDRYGPSRSREPTVAPMAVPIAASAAGPLLAGREPSAYSGRLLNWSGKPAGPPPGAAPPPVTRPFVAPSPVASAPSPQVYASRGPAPARLPTSLYDTPVPAPAPGRGC